jgi:hypothetical protein
MQDYGQQCKYNFQGKIHRFIARLVTSSLMYIFRLAHVALLCNKPLESASASGLLDTLERVEIWSSEMCPS